jgi:iron complex outermembrane recepter protein
VSDTIAFTKEWSARLAIGKDWMHTRNYNKAGAQTSAYADDGYSPMPSVIYKPREDMTIYLTYANSLQQGDLAPAGSANANSGLPPYRSKQYEAGFKMAFSKLDFSAAVFRLERPFANVDPADNGFKIFGDQKNVGLEAMAIGEVAPNLTLYGGITLLDAKMEGTGKPATDGKLYVGVPKLKSNFLVEYRVPPVPGLVLVCDWQYSTKRPANDSNTTYAASYNTFDVGVRYATRIQGKVATWRAAVNNVGDERYWSSVAPSSITGTNLGNMVAHVGAPRTVVVSLSIDF